MSRAAERHLGGGAGPLLDQTGHQVARQPLAQRFAEAGSVVEKTDQAFRSVAVPVSELDAYRTDWQREREEIFRSGASTFIRGYARWYEQELPGYVEAYRQLRAHHDIFDQWARIKAAGDAPALGRLMLQRREVSPALLEMRGIFPFFEQIYYRLKVMERFHREGVGRTQIDGGRSSIDFFNNFNETAERIELTLAQVRFYFKLFSWSGGTDSSLLDEMFSDTNPLEGGGPPKPTDPDDL